jgi:hypothetical protein
MGDSALVSFFRCFRGLRWGEVTLAGQTGDGSVGGRCGVSFVMPAVLRRIGRRSGRVCLESVDDQEALANK